MSESLSAFDHNCFLLHQTLLSFAEQYEVYDEQGNRLLYIERPAHLLRNFGAALIGVISGIAFVVLFTRLAEFTDSVKLKLMLLGLGLFGWLVVTLVVASALYQKRHITIYRDQSKQEPLLKLLQNKTIGFITATFTLRDHQGILATFRKNHLRSLFWTHWSCYAADGSLLCIAREESLTAALLQRISGTLFGLLRSNFLLISGDTSKAVGAFNRRAAIANRYRLDLYTPGFDRRIAIALGVLLDTAERR